VDFDAIAVTPDVTLPLRELYRKEMNCQIIRDSWHGRGWTNSYLLKVDGGIAGYGLVGGIRSNPRDVLMEFYVLPIYRGAALELFRQLITVSRAKTIEAQTNDVLLTLMLYDSAVKIESPNVLFHDARTTNLTVPGIICRRATEADQNRVFPHTVEPVGEWVIDADGEIAATGGILFHYNLPYGDIYMEVAEPFRQRGFGSYLVQELKRECYKMGRVPAARCDASNFASRATLQKAGFLPCARLLTGVIDAV
jgi:GNAT superfamily N-acetyltransferase